jgi:hypothetical protein
MPLATVAAAAVLQPVARRDGHRLRSAVPRTLVLRRRASGARFDLLLAPQGIGNFIRIFRDCFQDSVRSGHGNGRLAGRLIHPDARWFAVFACFALRWINYEAADARPYALGICIAAAGLWFLIRWFDFQRVPDALLFLFFAAVLWRVHLIYWPFYAVFIVYALIRTKLGETRLKWWQPGLAFIALAAALLPVAVAALPILREAGAHAFTELPDIRHFEHAIRWSLVAICGAGAWLAARILGWAPDRTRRTSQSSLALIALWWLAQPVCLYIFSRLTGNSVFIDRYLSIALPGAALSATAAAAMWIPARHWQSAALALGIAVLLVSGQWTAGAPRHDNSDWRAAASMENQLATDSATPVICPSPFVEARSPVWQPDYPLPGFLYSHLSFYPVKGRLLLFPFERADGERFASDTTAELSRSARFLIYGADANVTFWRDWFARRPELDGWQSRTLTFGDIRIAVFDRKTPPETGKS